MIKSLEDFTPEEARARLREACLEIQRLQMCIAPLEDRVSLLMESVTLLLRAENERWKANG